MSLMEPTLPTSLPMQSLKNFLYFRVGKHSNIVSLTTSILPQSLKTFEFPPIQRLKNSRPVQGSMFKLPPNREFENFLLW